jgi:hypothetical protein
VEFDLLYHVANKLPEIMTTLRQEELKRGARFVEIRFKPEFIPGELLPRLVRVGGLLSTGGVHAVNVQVID